VVSFAGSGGQDGPEYAIIKSNKELFDLIDLNEYDVSYSNFRDSLNHKEQLISILYKINLILLQNQSNEYYQLEKTFTYCWEKSKFAIANLECAKKIALKTEILVIIGYSFPYVNKQFDIDIINSMTKLSKVYIQDPNVDSSMIEYLRERFQSFHGMLKIIPIKSESEFFLPNEL